MHRREALSSFAGAAAILAGCSGFAGSADESSSETSGAGRTVTDGPSSGTETAPEQVLVRADTDRRPVWLADPDSDDGGRPTSRRDERHIGSVVVDSESRADRLTVAADAGDDAGGVESFIAATDFDAETVFVETIRVEECFRLELCRISWQPEKVSTDYARRGRPYDEPCRTDERVFEARLIRLPDVLDADNIRAGATSIGTGGCRRSGGAATGAGGADSGSTSPRDTDADPPTGTNATVAGEQ